VEYKRLLFPIHRKSPQPRPAITLPNRRRANDVHTTFRPGRGGGTTTTQPRARNTTATRRRWRAADLRLHPQRPRAGRPRLPDPGRASRRFLRRALLVLARRSSLRVPYLTCPFPCNSRVILA
jgi:hypothetical protein